MSDDLQVSLDVLTTPVRRSLDRDDVEITRWTAEPVDGGFGHAYGLFRLHGEVRSGGETLPWSIILKIVGPATGSLDPAASDYWKREVLVYQSGWLDDLPGPLVAPRCYGVDEGPNQERRLWLEDVVEDEPVWPLERYGLAARHLGHFNGAYLADRAIPRAPWLSVNPLGRRLKIAAPGVAQLRALSGHQLFQGLMPSGGIDRLLALWEHRDRCLAALDRLPRTLCHHDAFRRNLLARKDPQGREQTVAIDWSAAGIGPVGAEIAELLRSLRFVAVDVDRLPDFDTLIYEGYVAGLRDSGWQGDQHLARFGYLMTATLDNVADKAIKWPRVARRAAALPPGAEPPRLLSPGGPAQALAVNSYLLDMGDEALELLDALN